MKRIPRRIFTEEFKREAIKLVTEQGLTMAEASRKLDVAPNHYAPGWISKHVVNSNLVLAHQSSQLISSAFVNWSVSWP